MLSRFIGLLLCLVGVLLPYRLRIAYAELLGWLTQAFYYAYYGILNYMLSELREAERERLAGEEREG